MPLAYMGLEEIYEIVNAHEDISSKKKKTKTDEVLLKFIEIYLGSITSYSIKDLKVLLGIYKDKNVSDELKEEIRCLIFNLKTAKDVLQDWDKQKDINKPYFYDLPIIPPYFVESFPSKTGDPIAPYYQIISTVAAPYKEPKGKK